MSEMGLGRLEQPLPPGRQSARFWRISAQNYPGSSATATNAAASALAVLARLRHFTRLRDAADLLPGRSHLKQLFSLFRVHPFRCRAPWVGMLDGLATHLELKRTTREFGLAGCPLVVSFAAGKISLNPP